MFKRYSRNFKFFPNNILGVSHKKIFSKYNEHDSCQSKFNILSFRSNKFDVKQEILLIKRVLNIETLKNMCYIALWNIFLVNQGVNC